MIHARATVQASCTLGDNVSVWQGASVIRSAWIGEGSSIGSCAIVDGARIGPRARIGHGAQVHPGAVAGCDLFLGPGAILCNDMYPWLGGKDFDIDGLVAGRSISILIEDRVTIGAGAIVLPGVRLGEGCVVAAGVTVRKDVPPGVIDLGGAFRPIRNSRRRMRLVV